VRTCLLRNFAAAHHTDVEAALHLSPGERVRSSERPVAHAVSPDQVTGVDCRLPSASGARVRGIGTVTGHAVVTGGRLLQGSVFTHLTRGEADRRLPWSHYLAEPGVVETTGRFDRADVVRGFLGADREPGASLDLGALSEQVIRQVQASARLDHVAPFKSRRTRLRWVASQDDEVRGELVVVDDVARTFRVHSPAPLPAVVELCEDLALHDWVLTTVLRIVERTRIGAVTGPEVLTRLRPAIDHLLHLWMPGARVDAVLLPVWESLERRPGFSLQWRALVARIRDQLAVHTLETLSRLRQTEKVENGGGSVGGVR
jgi:hypothetical protein